jgi:antibiotic biosynthesis monooxygenase (ABM) superfamily enzyme
MKSKIHELKKNNLKNVSKTKMKLIAALKIWVVIYPSITLFLYLLSKSSLELPLYLKTLFLTLILVPWVVFVGVPFVDFIMRQLSTEIDKK